MVLWLRNFCVEVGQRIHVTVVLSDPSFNIFINVYCLSIWLFGFVDDSVDGRPATSCGVLKGNRGDVNSTSGHRVDTSWALDINSRVSRISLIIWKSLKCLQQQYQQKTASVEIAVLKILKTSKFYSKLAKLESDAKIIHKHNSLKLTVAKTHHGQPSMC